MTIAFSEKTNRVIERAARNVLRKYPVWSLEVEDVVQEGWLYIAAHADWYEANSDKEENLYRRLHDRLVVIVQRDQKKRNHETSLEALEEDALVLT